MAEARTLPHMAHWGAFRVTVVDDEIVDVAGHPDDPAPSPLNDNFVDGVRRGRVARPSIRRGWLDRRPGSGSADAGRDTYVEVPWDEALDLAAAELRRVRDDARQRVDLRRLLRLGERRSLPPRPEPAAPLPQLHRWLHVVGQLATRSPAPRCCCPHIIGYSDVRYRATTWPEILDHTDLVVAFGGMNPKNAWVVPGGVTRHTLVPVAGRGRPARAGVRAVQPAAGRPSARASARRGTRSGPGPTPP